MFNCYGSLHLHSLHIIIHDFVHVFTRSRQSFPLQLLFVILIPSVLNIPTRLVMLVHITVRIGNNYRLCKYTHQ